MRSKACWTCLFALLAIALVGCDADGDTGPAAADGTSASDDTSTDDASTNDASTNDASTDDTGSDGSNAGPSGDTVADDATPTATDPTATASFDVRESVGQLQVWNAPIEAGLELLGADGSVIDAVTTDYQGSYIFRKLEPGDGYVIRVTDTPDDWAGPLRVMAEQESLPPQSFYSDQALAPGFGYITTRDGTQLSIYVQMPGPPEDGPYPTVVNYSGYSPSEPGSSLGAIVESYCADFPVLCDAPGHPTGLLAGIFGYASVGVNVRGTGCSGGAYDYFETPQLLDGYDVIETVAAQPWVLHNKVGMGGLSYPGITQLFVAKMQPPSLAAITPLSVIADTATSTLAPGGIYNLGFALAWIDNVVKRAAPYGHKWVTGVVEAGDSVCEENQLLHSQAVDGTQLALDNPYYTDEVARPLDPSDFAHLIEAPVFLAGQWNDEQTGPHFPALFDKFTGTDVARFTVTNGVHPDGFAPQVLMEWRNFLDLYVARRVPRTSEILAPLLPLFFQSFTGTSVSSPGDRLGGYDTYEEALAAYEAEPPLRVIFETGANGVTEPGAPEGSFEASFDAWPIPDTEARRWYFQADGTLTDAPPGEEDGDTTLHSSSFHPDSEAGPRTTLASGSVNDLQPNWDYQPLAEGHALAWVSEPLETDTVMVGHGSIDLWLSSTATDADLEVILTEVRPDGMESHVQAGWLRASQRALRYDATELRPVKTHREDDLQPLVPGEWTEARVELMPFGHVFHAGSRVRISVDTPGDSMASWHFILLEDVDETDSHTIGHSAAFPSSVVLPVIAGVDVPTERPDCHALRGQPCREYVTLEN